MTGGLTIRLATEADLGALRDLMTLSIDRGQAAVLTPAQIVASRSLMGLDTQLVRDGTYFVVEDHGVPVGCGGWSRSIRRRTPRASAPCTLTRTMSGAVSAG